MDDMQSLIDKILEALKRDGEDISIKSRTQGNTNYFLIQRKPAGDPKWYADESGEIILDWKEKFNREQEGVFPPFHNGEYILINGFVEPEQDGKYKIHIDADGRVADNFFINAADDADRLKEYKGMPLEMIVKIVDEKKQRYRISDIWNYYADFVKIISMPIVNPTAKQLTDAADGTRVIIKGRFIGFAESLEDKFLQSQGFPRGSYSAGEKSESFAGVSAVTLDVITPDGKKTKHTLMNPSDDYRKSGTYATIKTPEGEIIKISMPLGRIRYSGGMLENLDSKFPMAGDEVKIAPKVTKDKTLMVAWCDPCYLEKPSSVRLDEYQNLRITARNNIQSILSYVSNKDYRNARLSIGDAKNLELTASELEDIRAARGLMPDSERPVQTPISEHNPTGKKDYYVKSIEDSFDTGLESMTAAEFIEFAKNATAGELQPSKDTDVSYLFSIAESFGIDKKMQEAIIKGCIDTRLAKIETKKYRGIDFTDKYTVGQAMKYLAGIGTESASKSSFEYMRRFVKNGSYRELGWREHDRDKEHFLFGAMEAISMNLGDINQDVLFTELPYLQSLHIFLDQNADEPVTKEVLDRTINYVLEKTIIN